VQQPEYELILTEDDKIAMLNIINSTTFKGQDVEYVSQLKVRVSEAPLRAPVTPPNQGGQKK
jgi:hypothetical protein